MGSSGRFFGSNRSSGLRIALRRIGSLSCSFLRLSAMNRGNASPSFALITESRRDISAMSCVVSILRGSLPFCPINRRYIGSSRVNSTWSDSFSPAEAKTSSST
jgi:hypothetical protein